ncbi:Ankyrin repeat-containing domain protein [Cordyceps fumosorosea ARSEF 2679]|uniref:Ankyrin repeat-containing domain protein n=1 Tax=Cordyceps fumosorosea (strain ARSEF 2679) TaxID=1081104 RepID=A0A167LMZ5_CORFA|nr:Ankyrin repeat-containing domain protein [Cordyceps fumosorosea ARSEF 2679]OAA53279.1 Ankyrin repeat-containing domain protein [Cordyceps fumosorosea ARSEF 2679]
MAATTLDSLPPEMLLAIASFLGSTGSISRLARTSRRMRHILDKYLYFYDVDTSPKGARALCAASCFPKANRETSRRIIAKSLAAGADVNATLEIHPEDDVEPDGSWKGMLGNSHTYHTTALAMAVFTGNAALVRLLLNAGANINATCWMGVSVLRYAMISGDLPIVRLLAAWPGIDIGGWCRQQDAPLLDAVDRGALDLVRALLPHADPNRPGRDGVAPLRMAVQKQNCDMVALLLSDPRTDPNDMTGVGVCPIIGAKKYSAAGPRPLSIFATACRLKSTPIVQLLHDDARTDVDWCLEEWQSPVTVALSHQRLSNVDILIGSNKSKTARNVIFCNACMNRDFELASRVLSLSTYDDRIFAKRWAEEAQAAGLQELATQVAAKWNPSTAIRQ